MIPDSRDLFLGGRDRCQAGVSPPPVADESCMAVPEPAIAIPPTLRIGLLGTVVNSSGTAMQCSPGRGAAGGVAGPVGIVFLGIAFRTHERGIHDYSPLTKTKMTNYEMKNPSGNLELRWNRWSPQ